MRSFKFEKEGPYSAAEVEALRAQLKGTGWRSMVDDSSKAGSDNAGVYTRMDGKQMTGLVVLAFEPKTVTVVNISGTSDPDQIQALSGTLGIPSFHAGFDGKTPNKSKE